MLEDQRLLQDSLDDLLAEAGVNGGALVSRDGIPVLSQFSRALEQMAFSILVEGAMMATLMGAAETAVTEVEGGVLKRVIIDAEKTRIFVVGATEDLILVAVADAESPLNDVLTSLDSCVASIREIATGVRDG